MNYDAGDGKSGYCYNANITNSKRTLCYPETNSAWKKISGKERSQYGFMDPII